MSESFSPPRHRGAYIADLYMTIAREPGPSEGSERERSTLESSEFCRKERLKVAAGEVRIPPAPSCATVRSAGALFRFVHRPSHELAVVDPDGADENNLTGRVDVAAALARRPHAATVLEALR